MFLWVFFSKVVRETNAVNHVCKIYGTFFMNIYSAEPLGRERLGCCLPLCIYEKSADANIDVLESKQCCTAGR